ncbi:MAG: porin [Alphaproteobacteria bacterium]
MKKVLLSTAAIAGMAVIANPAAAQVKLELGGYFKGYGVYSDTDEDSAATAENRDLDIIRNTEVHFGGETTLDNGLTVGAHIEAEADGNSADSFEAQESYVYFSGGWGRVNFGAEDGAAYLLQVAAPSGDSNIDGIRQYVNPVHYTTATGGTGLTTLAVEGGLGLDYAQDVTGYADKLTYLSPIMNGFQLGLSYTPDVADASTEDALNLDEVDDTLGSAYEGAVRYEGMFNNVGIIAGAGYTHVDLEENLAPQAAGDSFSDDRQAWNVGLDLDIGPFGVGASYKEDNYGEDPVSATDEMDDEQTWVVGVDYTTGPFKLGASYMNVDGTRNIAGAVGNDGIETDRYTGGVVYTYGPGMTFRGSISHVEHDNVAGLTTGDSIDATSVTLGTQINF